MGVFKLLLTLAPISVFLFFWVKYFIVEPFISKEIDTFTPVSEEPYLIASLLFDPLIPLIFALYGSWLFTRFFVNPAVEHSKRTPFYGIVGYSSLILFFALIVLYYNFGYGVTLLYSLFVLSALMSVTNFFVISKWK